MDFGRFITLWTNPDYPPDAVSEGELNRAEDSLPTRLPAEYRNAVLQFGLPHPTIELLDAIVDRELELRDVNRFLSPSEIVTETEEWRALGLPKGLVAFASDCMGNLFCFPTQADVDGKVPVFYFDHDQGSAEVIAPSFSGWIDEFCALAPH